MLPFVFIKTTLLRMTARKRLIFFYLRISQLCRIFKYAKWSNIPLKLKMQRSIPDENSKYYPS